MTKSLLFLIYEELLLIKKEKMNTPIVKWAKGINT